MEVNQPLQLKVFYTVDGRPVQGSNVIPYTDVSWTLGWNTEGTMQIQIRWHKLIAYWSARLKLRPWLHSVAVIEGDQVPFAGPILSRNWEGLTLTINVGDGWALWRKRLVLNHALSVSWVDGEVVIDEDNPTPNWRLSFTGLSLAGIGAGLIRESLKWGQYLIDEPPLEAGDNVRNYLCADLATVHDRLQDLTGVIGGPLIRFPAYIRPVDGFLRLSYNTAVAPTTHTLSTEVPGHRVSLSSVDEDGEAMASAAFAVGGRDEDIVLVAASTNPILTDAGWPVMQIADKSHTSVSQIATLKGYTDQLVIDGAALPESFELLVATSRSILIGDWVDLFTDDSYLGRRLIPIVVVEVSRTSSDWQRIRAFPREGL